MLSTFFIVIVTHKTQTFQHVSVEHDVTNMEDDRKKKKNSPIKDELFSTFY